MGSVTNTQGASPWYSHSISVNWMVAPMTRQRYTTPRTVALVGSIGANGVTVVANQSLVDRTVNTRVLLAFLWVCHFILWIFGDMFSLLQEMNEPVTASAVLFVAPTTAIVLTLLVVFSLLGRPSHVRVANLVIAPVYLLFNIGFMVEATEGWEYYLGAFYILFTVLIIWQAYMWPRTDQG